MPLTWLLLFFVQSLSGIWLFVTPMDCSTPGFPVLHHFPELAQTRVHWVDDTTQPSYPLSPPSFGFSLSQHQDLSQYSESFSMSQFFTSGGQNIRASASESVLPMIIQDWFPLVWTGWISLVSKGLPRVFSSTTIQRHQFFSAQPLLLSSSYFRAWLLEKP